VKVAAAPPPEAAKPDDGKPAPDEKPTGSDADTAKEDPSKPEAATKAKRQPFPVVIKSDPEGTRVTTGKHTFGSTPLTLKLRPGSSYEFTFTKAGYVSLSRRYRFEAEAPQTLRVTLKKEPEPPHKAASAPPPAPPRGPPPVPPHKGFFSR
jgi:hypothetical protein